MAAWEYRLLYMKHPAHFSDLGDAGWELAAISETERGTGNAYFYFKRQRAAQTDRDVAAAASSSTAERKRRGKA